MKGILVANLIFIMLYFSPSLIELSQGNGQVIDMIDVEYYLSEKTVSELGEQSFYAVWLDNNNFGLYYELQKGELTK